MISHMNNPIGVSQTPVMYNSYAYSSWLQFTIITCEFCIAGEANAFFLGPRGACLISKLQLSTGVGR